MFTTPAYRPPPFELLLGHILFHCHFLVLDPPPTSSRGGEERMGLPKVDGWGVFEIVKCFNLINCIKQNGIN